MVITCTMQPHALFVNGDSFYRDVRGCMLNMIGWCIQLVRRGLEAIKKNECREYDLIGKDIVMSIMSGNATSSADQKCESPTPIVVSVPSNFTHGYIMEYMEEFVWYSRKALCMFEIHASVKTPAMTRYKIHRAWLWTIISSGWKI